MKYDLEELLKENMNIQESPSEELKERILDHDKEEGIMDQNRKYMKHVPKIAAAALTVVILSSGIAYASSGFWNRFVAKEFGVEKDPETMQNMNDEGFAQQPHAQGEKGGQLSVTDKDIKVTVKQTLADEHNAYVCFEVKYGDKYQAVQKGKKKEADHRVAMPEWVDFKIDSGMSLNSSGSGNKIIDDHTVLYDYFLTTAGTQDTFKDSVITMAIPSFVMYDADAKPIVLAEEGKWELSWDLSVGTEKQVYHLDKTLTLGKDHIIVKDLEISPLSCNLTLEYPDGVTLDEIGGVVDYVEDEEKALDENGDLKVRYLHIGSEEGRNEIMEKLPEGQVLMLFDTIGIRLDGKDFDGMGGIGSSDGNTMYLQFNKVLDPKEVKGVRVAGKYIDLTGISPETVQ